MASDAIKDAAAEVMFHAKSLHALGPSHDRSVENDFFRAVGKLEDALGYSPPWLRPDATRVEYRVTWKDGPWALFRLYRSRYAAVQRFLRSESASIEERDVKLGRWKKSDAPEAYRGR